MPTRASKPPTENQGSLPVPPKPKRPRDVNMAAFAIVQEATGAAPAPSTAPDTRNQHAVALAALGASKGGKARAKKLSAAQRRDIAKRAAAKRWK